MSTIDIDISLCPSLVSAETVCMAKKEKAEEKEKGGGDGERDEEMEDVRDSSAGGGGFTIRDRWMLCHDITPLAMDVLTSKGVSVHFPTASESENRYSC